MDKCPFCGAEIKEYKVCPTCHHATGYFAGTEYICGTIQNDDDKEWFRSTDCLKTELVRKDELLREAVRKLNKVKDGIYVSSMPNRISDRRKQLYDYIVPMEDSIEAFLTNQEVVKVMEGK